MGIVALATWLCTALAGSFMLAIWLIENDVSSRGVGTSRLPGPVIIAHPLLAIGGLVVWIIYLIADRRMLAWVAVSTLVAVALLGSTMFTRWLSVQRTPWVEPTVALLAAGQGGGPVAATSLSEMPPEGNFPVPVVVGHGVLAVCTLILVLMTTLGIGAGLTADRVAACRRP